MRKGSLRPEKRHDVDFPVFVSFESANGSSQRVPCRFMNVSPSGASLETKVSLPLRANVLIHSAQYGRIGVASVRYCVRDGMKYNVGVQFASALKLSDPERKKILESAQREAAPPEL